MITKKTMHKIKPGQSGKTGQYENIGQETQIPTVLGNHRTLCVTKKFGVMGSEVKTFQHVTEGPVCDAALSTRGAVSLHAV